MIPATPPPSHQPSPSEHTDWCLGAKVWSVRGRLRVTHAYSRSWRCEGCAARRAEDLVEHLDEVSEADVLYLGLLDPRSHAAARKQAQRRQTGWVTGSPADHVHPRLLLVGLDVRPNDQDLDALGRADALDRLSELVASARYRRVRAYGTWAPDPRSRAGNPDWECLGVTSPASVDDKLAEAGIDNRWANLMGDDEDRIREVLDPDRVKRDGWGRPIGDRQ